MRRYLIGLVLFLPNSGLIAAHHAGTISDDRSTAVSGSPPVLEENSRFRARPSSAVSSSSFSLGGSRTVALQENTHSWRRFSRRAERSAEGGTGNGNDGKATGS